jgi:hypothetical protein
VPVYFEEQAKARGEKRWRLSIEANRLLEELKENAIILLISIPLRLRKSLRRFGICPSVEWRN